MATGSEPLIAIEPAGVSIYGVAQSRYFVVEGGAKTAKDYDMAIAAASMQRSVAIEAAMSAASAVVKVKQQKMKDLTDLLALMSQARADLKVKDTDVSDTGYAPGLAAQIKKVKDRYGIDIYYWDNKYHPVVAGDNIRRDSLEGGMVVLQSAIDENDNQLQQDMLTLQSWVSKRDEAYRSTSKAVKKILGTGASTIGNMGG